MFGKGSVYIKTVCVYNGLSFAISNRPRCFSTDKMCSSIVPLLFSGPCYFLSRLLAAKEAYAALPSFLPFLRALSLAELDVDDDDDVWWDNNKREERERWWREERLSGSTVRRERKRTHFYKLMLFHSLSLPIPQCSTLSVFLFTQRERKREKSFHSSADFVLHERTDFQCFFSLPCWK